MNKKWSKVDIFILVLQIISPVAAIIITCFLPKGQALSADVKLAIISAGIVIPIILLQITVITGQNKNENDVQRLEEKINILTQKLEESIHELSENICHISPILEQVFLTGNERAKRFVYRRMDEVTKTIRIALNNNNSGYLKPSEYYEELLYLAKLIINDYSERKENFNGEVWAMTSFADEEWIEDEGYEKLWTEKLTEIVDKGIKTRRVCVIPEIIYKLISSQSFSIDEANKIKAFNGFISFLENYYGDQARKEIAEHYFIRTNDNPELTRIKGFFAIKLSSGKLHILHGETVNEAGAITAKVLFDPTEIQRVRELFNRYTRPTQELGKIFSEVAKKNGFLTYLKSRNIEF